MEVVSDWEVIFGQRNKVQYSTYIISALYYIKLSWFLSSFVGKKIRLHFFLSCQCIVELWYCRHILDFTTPSSLKRLVLKQFSFAQHTSAAVVRWDKACLPVNAVCLCQAGSSLGQNPISLSHPCALAQFMCTLQPQGFHQWGAPSSWFSTSHSSSKLFPCKWITYQST